jgi:hypothetical protein
MDIIAILLFASSCNDYTSLLMITQQFLMLVVTVAQLPCPVVLYWMIAMMKVKFVLVKQKLNAALSRHRKF